MGISGSSEVWGMSHSGVSSAGLRTSCHPHRFASRPVGPPRPRACTTVDAPPFRNVVGIGVGSGRGHGVGSGRGHGVGSGRGHGVGSGRGHGVGSGRGIGVGVGVGVGVGWSVSVGRGSGDAQRAQGSGEGVRCGPGRHGGRWGIPARILAWDEHGDFGLERGAGNEPLGRIERGAAHELSPPPVRLAPGRPSAPSCSHHC